MEMDTPQLQSPPHHARGLTCSGCSKSFKRREHLDRHIQSHSASKSFSCPACPKRFSRKDSLQRHARVHGTSAVQALNLFRSTRACQLCAREKRRCSGDLPCLRCKDKNRECRFESPVSPEYVGAVPRSPFSAQPSSPATGVQAATPPSIIEEDTRPITGHGVSTKDAESLDSSTSYRPLSGRLESEITPRAPFPDLGLDWEIQDKQPYDISFSLPDMGNLFPWLFQTDQDSSLASQNSLPLEIGIPQPPQSTSLTDTPRTAHPLLPDTCTSRTRTWSLAPQIQSSDHIVLNAENSAHVSPIPVRAYQEILSFFQLQQAAGFPCYIFPEKNVLDTFIQLYFEHFDPIMPFIHYSFLEKEDVHWILVLAVASLGSQYTAIERKSQLIIVLLELLRRALPDDAITVLNYDMTMVAQSLLLYNISLMCCGYRDYLVILERQRAWLATIIQPLMSQSSINSSLNQFPYREPRGGPSVWQDWTLIEGQRRLVYCAWLFDCMAVVFMDMQPTLQYKDLNQQLPCEDPAWRARSAPEWETHYYSQTDQNDAASNLRTLFLEFCSSDTELTHASEFTRLLLLFTLWVEERQAVKGSRALSMMHGNRSATIATRTSDERLDAKFSQLQVTNMERFKLVDENMLRVRKTLYHVLFILRHVPLKSLHSSSGWRSSSSDANKNRRLIAQWMQDNPKFARNCAFHAASAFCEIRSLDSFDFSQAFSLLVAVQYLRIYQHTHICSLSFTSQEGEEEAHSSQQRRKALSQGITRAVRITPYQNDQDALVSQWISSGEPGLVLYLPGVGLLLEPLSPVCLLREFQRLLISREITGWPIIRAALSQNVEEILNEVTPLSQPPYSLDVER